MQLRRTMRDFGLALGVVAAGIIFTPSTVKAQDIVAILTCPMGCGVMEGNTIFGTMMAKANEKLIVAAQETPGIGSANPAPS